MDNQRNLILAVLLTGLVLFGWDAAVRYFYPATDTPAQRAAAVAEGTAQPGTASPAGASAPGMAAQRRRA